MNNTLHGLRLGGHVFVKTDDPVELARAHRKAGWSAAYCPAVDLNDTNRVRAIRDAFAGEDIVLAEVGEWCNLIAPDAAMRARNVAAVTTALATAEALGARCCVDYLGTFDPASDYGPHPDNLSAEAFDLAVETIRKIVDAVRPTRAKFGLEMMQWTLPDSVEVYADLIRAVDRPEFGAHLDPVNLIFAPRHYYDTGAFIRHAFAVLGPHVVSCHAKDLLLRNQLALHYDEVRPGLGGMNYRVYVQEIRKLGRDVPLMFEHLGSAEEYEAARVYLQSVAD